MSQKEAIRQYLLTGKTLSPIEALQKFRCFRLGARIWDLHHEGYEIENIGADDANYAVYRMKVEPWPVDNSTMTVEIPTPPGWKCPRPNCHIEVKHTHTTFTTLPPAFEKKAGETQKLFS